VGKKAKFYREKNLRKLTFCAVFLLGGGERSHSPGMHYAQL